jgi:D-glycerate 3-kinase
MSIKAFLEQHKLPDSYRATAQKWFTPLVQYIAMHHNNASETFALGIHGCQGSGKSTLADYLAHQLTHEHGLKVAICSLDDFYLSKDQRLKLSQQVHPLLKTRGVPGTHDITLLEQVLLHINQRNTLSPLAIPRFNKATDDPAPHGEWPVYSMPIDVFILEGWCWGVAPQEDKDLVTPVNILENELDSDAIWRKYVNTQLQNHYQPLYGLMNEWVMLKAPSFAQVAEWREEQESKLRAKHISLDNSNVMSKTQVQQFIQYFQRLTEHALTTLPAKCDWVYELDAKRNITHCIQRSGDVV